MNGSILVTGVAGFIGMHVAGALLARGERVIGIDNLNDYYPVQLKRDRLAQLRGLDFRELDFSDAAAVFELPEVDRIVHLGAQAGVRHSIENPAAYVASNLVGHCNILELARQRRVAHLVYASSSSVYGASALPFATSDRADRPLSLYAATKRADELLSESYAHLYRLPQTGLRFFTVYGPWGRPDMAMWLFTSAILEARPIQLFNGGEMRRDFTFIDDVVAGILAALDRPPADTGQASPHAIYNLGNHSSEPLPRVIALIEAACGARARIEPKGMQPGDAPDTFADIADAARDLGYAPTTAIDTGIPAFVEWYRGYTGA